MIQCVKKMSNRLDFTGDFIKSRPPEIISTSVTANEHLKTWSVLKYMMSGNVHGEVPFLTTEV